MSKMVHLDDISTKALLGLAKIDNLEPRVMAHTGELRALRVAPSYSSSIMLSAIYLLAFDKNIQSFCARALSDHTQNSMQITFQQIIL